MPEPFCSSEVMGAVWHDAGIKVNITTCHLPLLADRLDPVADPADGWDVQAAFYEERRVPMPDG